MRIVNALLRAEEPETVPPAPFEKLPGHATWVAELPLPGPVGSGSVKDVEKALHAISAAIGETAGGRLFLHLAFQDGPLHFEPELLKELASNDIRLEIVPVD